MTHDRHTVRYAHGNRELLFNERNCQSFLLEQQQIRFDPIHNFWCQALSRLIDDDQSGVSHHCSAQSWHLLISAKDAYRGETVKALIVLKEEFRQTTLEKDICDWAQGEMTTYKAPKRIEFVQSLPKSGSGKFLWRELQDLESQKNPLKRLSQVPSSS